MIWFLLVLLSCVLCVQSETDVSMQPRLLDPRLTPSSYARWWDGYYVPTEPCSASCCCPDVQRTNEVVVIETDPGDTTTGEFTLKSISWKEYKFRKDADCVSESDSDYPVALAFLDYAIPTSAIYFEVSGDAGVVRWLVSLSPDNNTLTIQSNVPGYDCAFTAERTLSPPPPYGPVRSYPSSQSAASSLSFVLESM